MKEENNQAKRCRFTLHLCKITIYGGAWYIPYEHNALQLKMRTVSLKKLWCQICQWRPPTVRHQWGIWYLVISSRPRSCEVSSSGWSFLSMSDVTTWLGGWPNDCSKVAHIFSITFLSHAENSTLITEEFNPQIDCYRVSAFELEHL